MRACGISSQAGGGIAGAGADDRARPQDYRLGDGSRHSCVFERAGRITTLVFERERVQSGVGCGNRRIVKRRVAFCECYELSVVCERQQLTIAPDAASVAWIK